MVNKQYLDDGIIFLADKIGDTMNGDLSMNLVNNISNLADPIEEQNAMSKENVYEFVDNLVD